MKKLQAIAAFLLGIGLSSPAVAGGTGDLDGRTFEVTAGVDGESEGYADTLVYSAGEFRSVVCDDYGFASSEYRTEKKNGVTTFTSKSKSKTEGVAEWRGTVKGGAIEGSFVWIKDGKKTTYWFKGSRKG